MASKSCLLGTIQNFNSEALKLKIDQSLIQGAGEGLFAGRDFEADEELREYWGEIRILDMKGEKKSKISQFISLCMRVVVCQNAIFPSL